LLLQDTPLYEVLYQESTALNQRKKELRVRAEAEMLSTCTFAPKLTSQQLVKSGRVMQVRAAREFGHGHVATATAALRGCSAFSACCMWPLQQLTAVPAPQCQKDFN
jgi:hypothetical protein